MELAPGLRRIGNDLIAAYLVEDDSGATLIDARLRGQWRDLLAELKAMGRNVDDIRALILTHGDFDHIGFAERLRRDHGVPVYVHGADAERAKGINLVTPKFGSMRPVPLVRLLGFTAVRGGFKTTYLTQVTEVADGQVLDAPGSPRIISLPGHSPGSIAIHVPAVDAVFVGDALTTRHVETAPPSSS